jgi:hypothetical protein
VRETRLHGSEGGGTELNRSSLPLSFREARMPHLEHDGDAPRGPGVRVFRETTQEDLIDRPVIGIVVLVERRDRADGPKLGRVVQVVGMEEWRVSHGSPPGAAELGLAPLGSLDLGADPRDLRVVVEPPASSSLRGRNPLRRDEIFNPVNRLVDPSCRFADGIKEPANRQQIVDDLPPSHR